MRQREHPAHAATLAGTSLRSPAARRRIALAAFTAAALLATQPLVAPAQQPPGPAQKPGNPFCLKPEPIEDTPEIFGPTDIGATVGNQRLSVAVNPQGTLSVMRWPSPSYYEQLKYFTVDRDLPRLGLEPNEGAFSGLALRLEDGGTELVWLRDLRIRQRYGSPDSDTVVTRFRSREHGFVVEIADVVPQGADVLLRRHVLRLDRDSAVRSARLVSFANLNPTASKRPVVPTEDWCEEEGGTDVARYDPGADAVVYDITEQDFSTLSPRESSVAVAIGASRPSDGHQVGADHYTGHPSAQAGPQSAYDDAADGELSGNDRHGPAEVDSALSIPIGRRPVTVAFAAAASSARALELLDRFRGRDPVREAREKRQEYLRWLRDAPLPADAPGAVTRLAKRALISLRQAIDERAGPGGRDVAIVASIATQSPYGQDWIRDGAFFNEALDVIGHHRLVERHNDFYVAVQKTLSDGAPPGSPLTTCAPPTPAGNWFQTNYADGGDSGTFPWEIDEAAFGLWTLWRHHQRGDARRGYLERVYPALQLTADFLVAFRDPITKLPPGTACEDDNPPRPGQPTMHSAGPVLLAMRSAAAAAAELGHGDDAARYRDRVRELELAIDQRYSPDAGAWTTDYGVGGWALWPVRVKHDYADPRMRAQAKAAWRAAEPSFAAPDGDRKRGQYEAKALHGLAYFHRAVDPGGMERVKRGLRWIAEVQAADQDTGILGEVWYVRDGEVISVVSQPHVWEQVLFYLAALRAYGEEGYEAGGRDRLLEPARRGPDSPSAETPSPAPIPSPAPPPLPEPPLGGGLLP